MIAVRPAHESDAELWAEMRHALWPSLSVEGHLKDIDQALSANNVGNFVAEVSETKSLIGFMELAIRPYVDGCDTKNVAFVEGIWIAEDHRRSGIGRKFLKVAEAWARDKGCKELASNAELSNTLSHQAHIGWGFEETERVVYFRKGIP